MPISIRIRRIILLIAVSAALLVPRSRAAEIPVNNSSQGYDLFGQTNLMAWCIVPFDSKKRGPEERAAMLAKLQLSKFVYDYRAEHIPTFGSEIEALQKNHIQLVGWWFPTSLNDEARSTLELFKKYKIHPQLWVMGGGDPTHSPEEQRARLQSEAKRIGSIAVAGAQIGSVVGLYNHGGWFGEPENQIEIIQQLRAQNITNVGIVYNQHHGHDHIARFPELLQKMKPYLLALNINGMDRDGEKNGRQILPVGQGKLDLALLKIIQASGWHGPIGILCHAQVDAEQRLRDNLEGLASLKAQLAGADAGPKPKPRSWPE
jgi:hypothetical protein